MRFGERMTSVAASFKSCVSFSAPSVKFAFPPRYVAFGGRTSKAGIRWERPEWFHQCWCWCWCSPERFAHGGSGVAATHNHDAHHLLPHTGRTGVTPRRASLWISPRWRRTWITSWHKWRTLPSPSIRARRRSSTTTWSWTFWRIHQSPATTAVPQGMYRLRIHMYSAGKTGSPTGQSRVSCAAVHLGGGRNCYCASAGRSPSCWSSCYPT